MIKKVSQLNFFTPEVHKIINSLSSLCFKINIIIDIKNERGINLGAIPKSLKGSI